MAEEVRKALALGNAEFNTLALWGGLVGVQGTLRTGVPSPSLTTVLRVNSLVSNKMF